MMENQQIHSFIRPDFRDIVPYSSARDECDGLGDVFLDANENGFVTEFNRYPDPFQKELKQTIAQIKKCDPNNCFIGNGSDEVLDLIFRLVGTPFQDQVATLNPSYCMYSVLAKLNGLQLKTIDLEKDLSVDYSKVILESEWSKLLIICNPNNPTGQLIPKTELIQIVSNFKGVVVIDEAYIDFCDTESMASEVNRFSNLIVTQTLSKAYGMAGLRIGIAIASSNWILALNSVKPPYNLSTIVQQKAIELLKNTDWDEVKRNVLDERSQLINFLNELPIVDHVFPTHANFILFRIQQADSVYAQLIKSGVVVRNRSKQFNCSNTLRVSVGNDIENERFRVAMNDLNEQFKN